VQEGGEIPIYYDPMIAKLVTHARRCCPRSPQSMALDVFYKSTASGTTFRSCLR